jgi:hypothetical protein
VVKAVWETDPSCRAFAADPSFEFVPVISDLKYLDPSKPLQSHSKILLGMNEPSSHKNESAQLAASRWPEYEAIAAKFTPPLLLGSPAPGGLKLDVGLKWLTDFFARE